MAEHDDIIERVAETLKQPVRIDPSFDARVMSKIGDLPVPGSAMPVTQSVFEWLRRRRTIRLSPLGGLAMAAGVAAVVLVGSRLLGPSAASGPSQIGAGAEQTIIQFVLVAPGAVSVTVVGDFNDWNVSRTPLIQDRGDGVWSVTVPLAPGRYRYSFLVDGMTWLKDPRAAPAVEDEFGRPNSVLTIGGA